MRARAVAGMVITAALLAGCEGAVESSPSSTTGGPASPAAVVVASPSPAATPSAGPTLAPIAPVPTPSASAAVPTPPTGLARVAVVKRDGIRVRIELQRNPLVAGEPSWVRVTVTNTGRDVVTWFHDGCALAAWVHGESLVALDEGVGHPPKAQMFKQYALGSYNGQPLPAAWIRFVPEAMLGKGSYGCADIGMSDRIAPHEKLRQTMWWTGYTDVNRALPPTGPLRVLATAGYYWRGTKDPGDIPEHTLDLAIDAWVVGGADAGRLSPAQVVDAAVADPSFAAYLETQELANGREEIAWYDADAGAWEVGVMPWYETVPPRIHGVLVHAVTGEILGVLDRPWDEKADGFP